ncbi:VOC family protein [Brevibacillus marinus]|uniref:VOC family protein n=1 Tax=Brevibacillus marinus TaxID=2496837 RepID=UPI000F84700B|nr:VOC family protein [Brevibacillus marinus]
MEIERIDHLVLTVRNVEQTIRFYTEILGMKAVTFGNNRKALTFGTQKINLHQYGNEFEPKAKQPVPGSADLCLITKTPLHDVHSFLTSKGIAIEEGPVHRTGALGQLVSLYIRDPDQNLIELSNYIMDV